MVSVYKDETLRFNAAAKIQIDTSQYDYVLVQIIQTGAATINFNSTIDGGAATGTHDDNPASATNWTSCIGTNQATNTTAISTASNNSIWKFTVVGRFLQLTATAGTTVTKLLVMYSKIQ